MCGWGRFGPPQVGDFNRVVLAAWVVMVGLRSRVTWVLWAARVPLRRGRVATRPYQG